MGFTTAVAATLDGSHRKGSAEPARKAGLKVSRVRVRCFAQRSGTGGGSGAKIGGVALLCPEGTDLTKRGKKTVSPPGEAPPATGCVLFDHTFGVEGAVEAAQYKLLTSSYPEQSDPTEWTLEAVLAGRGRHPASAKDSKKSKAAAAAAAAASAAASAAAGGGDAWVVLHRFGGGGGAASPALPKARLVWSKPYALSSAALPPAATEADGCDPRLSVSSLSALNADSDDEHLPSLSSSPPHPPSPYSAGAQQQQRVCYVPAGVDTANAHHAFSTLLSTTAIESGDTTVLFEQESVVHCSQKGKLFVLFVRSAERNGEAAAAAAADGGGAASSSDKGSPSSAGGGGAAADFHAVVWSPYCLLLTVNQNMISKEAFGKIANLEDVPFCEGDTSMITTYRSEWQNACIVPASHLISYKKKEPAIGGKSTVLTSGVPPASAPLQHPPFVFRSRGATRFCGLLDTILAKRASSRNSGAFAIPGLRRNDNPRTLASLFQPAALLPLVDFPLFPTRENNKSVVVFVGSCLPLGHPLSHHGLRHSPRGEKRRLLSHPCRLLLHGTTQSRQGSRPCCCCTGWRAWRRRGVG